MKEFSAEKRRRLFDGKEVSAVLPYHSLEGNRAITQEKKGRLSVSGAQEKYGLIEENGQLRLNNNDEKGRFILKPQSGDRRFMYREDMPANEDLTMDIAEHVYDIPVAAHGLCFLGNGESAYITRRFDYDAAGNKFKMEDFASVAKLSKEQNGEDYKYTALSYEDCAQIIKDHCIAAQVELLKFYRILIFNYLTCNGDAHAKNFSLIEYREGDVRLAPGYDLLNTDMHLSTGLFALEKGLFKEGTPILDTTPIGRPMFLEFGRRIGLNEKTIGRELDFFAATYPVVRELIDGSLLSADAKESYWGGYKYRLSTMQP